MLSWDDFINDFPWTSFSDINVSWFLAKFKQIFDEWNGLYTSLLEWKNATDTYNEHWRQQQEQDFAHWENNFQNAIDAWKAQTETDINIWEQDTITNLENWKNVFITEYNTLKAQVEQIAIDAENAKNSAQASAVSAQNSADSASATALALQASLNQINTNTNDISGLKTQIGYTKNYLVGYYVARDGTLVVDPDYCASEFIPLAYMPVAFTFYYGAYGGAKTNVAFYDSVGSFIGFASGASGASERNVSTYPENSVFIRFGFNKNYIGKVHNARGYNYWIAQKYSILESSVINYPPDKIGSANFTSGLPTTEMGAVLEQNAIKNPTIFFYGKINSNFTYVDVGHGKGATYTEYFRIDRTNLEIHSNVSGVSTIAHGLTIDTYIAIIVMVKSNSDYTIMINTLGGSYSRSFAKPNVWQGIKGHIFARAGTANSIQTFAFTFTGPYNKNKWLFGDSYLSNYSESRWPYYMQTWGFDNTLINAFPGENSQQAYIDFCSALTHGNPKYIIWALGMNNPDSGAVNADWLNIVQLVKTDCENRGIELILATIPCTPSYDNSYKNTWIKNSGLRYIDFAEAVGATKAGSTWYPGTLEEGTVRTHPTADGARLLACRALTDFPEFMLS